MQVFSSGNDEAIGTRSVTSQLWDSHKTAFAGSGGGDEGWSLPGTLSSGKAA